MYFEIFFSDYGLTCAKESVIKVWGKFFVVAKVTLDLDNNSSFNNSASCGFFTILFGIFLELLSVPE